MNIAVKTGTWASRYVKENSITVNVPENARVMDVIIAIGIPVEEVSVAVIGDRAVFKDYTLSDGDVIKLHPVIVGG